MYSQQDGLNQHRRMVHTGEKPLECEEADCGKKFAAKGGLEEHQQADCKPKLCSDCESKFARNDGLLRHRRTLHGMPMMGFKKAEMGPKNKHFHCHECRRGYSRSDGLSRHERRFHKEGANAKPFQCDSCGKRFARSDQLAKHEVYCNGFDVSESEMNDADEMDNEEEMDSLVEDANDPPFQCDCGKGYTSHYSLSQHRRTCNGLVNQEREPGDRNEMDIDADEETEIEVDVEMGEGNNGSELSHTE
jgi:KRAB domain-containing zinc finger protein